ncbi:MFS transporter [Bacillus badius]|uniref:MFS transporter n=1 Tax=Bacillus badius TaxID=1455 RepID=UPI0005AE0918|nr:MFS transporter [Bacillus badius]KIL73977.1 Multidrug-efflux transporter, major facilitator superfamily (MFS) [Bacillus badius]
MKDKNKDTNITILWMGRFLTSAGLTGISPFLPLYLEGLGVHDTKALLLWSSLAVSAPAVSYAICTPFWGKLTDRWSKKWMVIRALFGLGISIFLMGIAQTPFQLFLCRLCQGAFGGISDASAAFVALEVPKNKQGKILGHLQSASSIGLLAGPLMSGLLAGVWGFSFLLLFTGSLIMMFAFLSVFVLKERERKKLNHQRTHRVSAAFHSLFRDRTVRLFILAGILAKIGDFGIFTIFSPYIKSIVPEQAAIWVGLLIAATSMGEIVGSPWWGKRNDSSSVEKNFFFAASLCGLFVLLQAFTQDVRWLLFIRFLQGFFFSALIQTVLFLVMQTSRQNSQGVRIGATNSVLVIGQIIGSFMGSLLAGYLDMPVVFVLMGFVFISSSVLVWYSTLGSKQALFLNVKPYEKHK